jgi:transcription elongation factor GreA
MLELRIQKLEDAISNLRVMDESKIDISKVQILNKVKIKNKSNNSVMQYLIVAESEANVKEGKISVNTPIAQALLGKKVGDIVSVKVPSGALSLEIMDISL